MRKQFALVIVLLAALPTAGKEGDVTVCVLPVHASWAGKSLRHVQLGKPPQPGEFFVDLKMSLREGDASAASSGNLDGYLGAACETSGAVKMTFHRSVVSGWDAKAAE